MTHQFHCSLILILILCLLFTSILFPPKRKHIKKNYNKKKPIKKKKKPFYTTSCVYCWYISSAHQFHQNVLKFLELHKFQVRERERERERERDHCDIIEWKRNHQAAMHPWVMQILLNIPYFIIRCSFTKKKKKKKEKKEREKAHSHLVVLKILSQENHKFIPQNIRFKNNIVRSNILMLQI